ncbi:Na+/H+ antiporter subunit E [Bradyrhizobium sp. 1(2017)]|jgi:multicomponent Na+:H+ antiporter subunit E|uniref:Na+/H+ antiporter subunit E n=1 Tax=Bradyrhizobium sp. 1(2017) TaxID=1404888 RepID=UPI00140ECC4C|nr:Na+/H+ antiporter subunit E [Bradyrhizobium sp. 1(2017)]QIO34824.1 Na+/H+ antiporter subunit E [Bradyrhizobium sp. 1(2017)]
MPGGVHEHAAAVTSAASRAVWFLCLWLVLAGVDPVDLPAAAAAVIAATWTSLRLLAPGTQRRSPIAMAQLALRFFCESVVASVDVARRALDPRLPLHPGFVLYPTELPRGERRNVFATLTSLLPGTVPTGDEEEQLIYHCLDVGQPIAAQLAAEEAALARVLDGG